MTISSIVFPLLVILGLAVIIYLLFSSKIAKNKGDRRGASSATKTRHKRKKHKKAHH